MEWGSGGGTEGCCSFWWYPTADRWNSRCTWRREMMWPERQCKKWYVAMKKYTCECVKPVLRGLQGGGHFILTELSHCQGGESLVRSVGTTRGVLWGAFEQISASKSKEVIYIYIYEDNELYAWENHGCCCWFWPEFNLLYKYCFVVNFGPFCMVRACKN